ncbi:MAG: hypothetical protein JW915_03040 [Chitinispirillaceae bacterium]|nr:hypothetical protein [Chitinispirillaceae bacterium]
MEIVAILATLLVAVLQIITISALKSTAKKVDELAAQRSSHSHNDRERSGGRDFRQQQNNRRTQADLKQKPQTQPATTTPSGSVEQVEKSLRDINLKLKNAERDQENARKKIQTNFSKDSNLKRHDNRDYGSRGGRDNNKRDRRGGNNWQERNNRRDSGNSSGNSADFNKSSEQSVNSSKGFGSEENPKVNQITNADAASLQPATQSTVEPTDFANDDSLQHGRKVSVKRRMLKEEDSVIESTTSADTSSQENGTTSSDSSENQQDASADSEIKFGRR